MEKIKEVIVVEGKDDTRRLALAVECDTIETNGSAIDQAILDQVQRAQEERGVIVFTDPDGPGEQIRKIISRAVPGVKHAFLTKEEARRINRTKESIGIEHASPAVICQALSRVSEEKLDQEPTVSKAFLIRQGLIGTPKAAALREQLGNQLRIGYTNGKQLEKRLNMFGISEKEVSKAMTQIRKETPHDRL
ncbi:Ribonuclease M5 [Alkalibacterium sp. AK22]|uniref:ribonuclease M5 n=1 Tax=Alkalibacterium sp. AK22 TaxID=1229520 RepID=UPI00044D6EE0|nr:ribonuclease M5 [Alkalibacterium sp. AK22]EXJ23465.1 Ribonuclease M5 [Alkalibacterium sp. AK22]